MSGYMGQPCSSLDQSMKERRPFANLSFFNNFSNKSNKTSPSKLSNRDEYEHGNKKRSEEKEKSDEKAGEKSEEKAGEKRLNSTPSRSANVVDFYRRLYLNDIIDFGVAQMCNRYWGVVGRKKTFNQNRRRRNIEEVVVAQKSSASKKFFSEYKKNGGASESGDFIVFEFFKVVLPLVTGSFDMNFRIFLCTVNEERKTLDYEELGSFWCTVNSNQKSFPVRETFLRRPPFKTSGSDIYLLAYCYGNVSNLNSNQVNCFNGVGIARIGRWTEASSLLVAQIDYSTRAVHIEQNQRDVVNIKELTNWKPDFGTLDKLRKKFLNKRALELDSFLSMELSNEHGIGDFTEEVNTEVQRAPRKRVCKAEIDQPAINKYIFNMSYCPIADGSTDCSSSGYGSMPSSSTSSSTTGESVDSDKSLSFSVASNSCVICSAKFNTISELLMHLEFRYPSLKFSYNSVFVDHICVTFPNFVESPSSPKDYVLLNRSLIKQYRARILSKTLNHEFNDSEISAEEPSSFKPNQLRIKECPVPFNPPIYQQVPFTGFYGVETPSGWLTTFQDRKLFEFVDVSSNEKEMMKMWNRFVNHRLNRVVTKTTCNLLVKNFAVNHASQIMKDKSLGLRQFLAHTAILFKRGLVDTETIQESVNILLASVEDKQLTTNIYTPEERCAANRPATSNISETEEQPRRPLKRSSDSTIPTKSSPSTSKRSKISIKPARARFFLRSNILKPPQTRRCSFTR